jgi:hypothetical protein
VCSIVGSVSGRLEACFLIGAHRAETAAVPCLWVGSGQIQAHSQPKRAENTRTVPSAALDHRALPVSTRLWLAFLLRLTGPLESFDASATRPV